MGSNTSSILSPLSSTNNTETKKDLKTMLMNSHSNFEVEYYDIFLDLSDKGLGISIRGGIDSPNPAGWTEIYVSRILNGGAVHQDGRLQLGDIIASVNDIPLVGVTHKEAVNIIIKAGPYIQFKIKRRKFDDSSEIYEQIFEGEEDEPLLMGNPNQLLHEDNDCLIENDPYTKGYNDCIQVELVRNVNGFGFSLRGGLENKTTLGDTGIFIDNIVPNSPAHLNGQIAIGDEIVAINDTNLECVPYKWALEVIRNSPALSIFTIRKQIQWN